jgi:hypothetical protein
MSKKLLNRIFIIFIAISILAGILAGFLFKQPKQVEAYGLNAINSKRKAQISVSFTTYEWWLLTWAHSQLICKVYVEHEGLPDPSEIGYYCGEQVKRDWLTTSPCEFSDDITRTEHCPGFYLHLVNVTPGERQIEVDLMPPEVFVDIANCNPQPPENRCETLPSLRLIGEEPLPNEHIINIQGYIGAQPFSCEGSECNVPLPATGNEGVQAIFWAESSFGDASTTFTARVRVIPWGDFAAPDTQTADQAQWYVDILSSQYLGASESTASRIWSSFPPVGGPPLWLSSPDHPDALISEQPYYYLAGALIKQGLVNVDACPDGGLESENIANQCGLEAARPAINQWQNQFNSEIIQVANETGVPAQLMKNIFSRESQFWPGFSSNYNEAGLGHLSDMGADTVLLWNPSFFSQFCPLVLDTTVCQKGFGNLDLSEQAMLRGALVQKVNAACPECPMGIDLSQANFSISIFARSLLANCEQVGQVIYNATRQVAGEASTYEDLWRFTLLNYNAGSGCLANAIQGATNARYSLTWENVIQFLEPGVCQASIDYVEDIAYMPGDPKPTATPTPGLETQPAVTSTPTSVFTPTPTSVFTSTPTSVFTSTPTSVPTATPESTGQPTPTPTATVSDYPIEPTATGVEPYP